MRGTLPTYLPKYIFPTPRRSSASKYNHKSIYQPPIPLSKSPKSSKSSPPNQNVNPNNLDPPQNHQNSPPNNHPPKKTKLPNNPPPNNPNLNPAPNLQNPQSPRHNPNRRGPEILHRRRRPNGTINPTRRSRSTEIHIKRP